MALLVACVCLLLPVSVQAGEVTIECTRDFYAPADSVWATWTNDTDSTVVAGNHPPFDIYEADSGELVCMVALPWEFHLGPHSTALVSWDQLDCELELVPPGRYLMRITYVYGSDIQHWFTIEDEFEILAPGATPAQPPGVQEKTWGAIKRCYR